ncbi:MCE family protein [Streptomyces sp. NBC_01387]|uniref:MCE family protein n=1 Tax=unclassified Streptomyces TaxID=2593676 RepID=UPI002024B8AE|nr:MULTISPECIES: MCE family protein [unclassified Streptomyces]MCX4553820.1 MCE family protein [Streptomyces sp. NBC_01500]WSC18734.1 MCE family protein [Streptomyces sp. NBC_01766]WSV52768.1 MCE family protein [Streptomyces sp. NBC_01014]
MNHTTRRVVTTGVGLALVAGVATTGVVALDDAEGNRVTAYFDQATGIYAGSDLRILGVKVGKVDSVRPQGKEVKVVLILDKGVKVPADAHAVIVASSVVADRYVQLSPAYAGGPQLKDRATLAADRNATPVEVDQLYASVTQLADALGPKGANSQGALSDLLNTGAANLDGNGKAIGDSIEQFGKATKTLDKSSGNLFDTLAYLQSFTTMLKGNDGKVHTAEQQLSTVTSFLDADKKDLGSALRELGTALGQVKTFIEKNRGSLKKSVSQLRPITETLVKQRASLAEMLDTAPLAAGNLVNAYDPVHRTIDGRGNLNELSMNSALNGASTPSAGGSALSGLVPVRPSEQKALPALPLPTVGDVYGSPSQSAPKTSSGAPSQKGATR